METWDLELDWLILPKKMQKAGDLTTVVPHGSERAIEQEVTEMSEVLQIHFQTFPGVMAGKSASLCSFQLQVMNDIISG